MKWLRNVGMILQSGCNTLLATGEKHKQDYRSFKMLDTLEIRLHHTYSTRVTFKDLVFFNDQHTHTTRYCLSLSLDISSY